MSERPSNARAATCSGEVGHGPDQGPRLGQARFGRRVGEAEVHHAHADPGAAVLARHHDVRGLDVAVDDAAGVAVVERLGGLDADVHDLAEAQRLVADQAQEVRAADERHHEEEGALVAAEIVDRDDRRVVHLRDDLRLPLEPLLEVSSQVGAGDELDRDLAVQERIAGAVDDAHAAAPELPEDLVAPGEDGVDQGRSPMAKVESSRKGDWRRRRPSRRREDRPE